MNNLIRTLNYPESRVLTIKLRHLAPGPYIGEEERPP